MLSLCSPTPCGATGKQDELRWHLPFQQVSQRHDRAHHLGCQAQRHMIIGLIFLAATPPRTTTHNNEQRHNGTRCKPSGQELSRNGEARRKVPCGTRYSKTQHTSVNLSACAHTFKKSTGGDVLISSAKGSGTTWKPSGARMSRSSRSSVCGTSACNRGASFDRLRMQQRTTSSFSLRT